MDSSSLFLDLDRLAVAFAHVKGGHADREAVFHLFFRSHPFGGGITIASGLESVVDFLNAYRFESEDLEYLSTLKGKNGEPLFETDFLYYLGDQSFACSIDAVPEGTVVFPWEPILRVQGPLVQALLLETPLLNTLNFQSLIATKAARVCLAAQGDPVIEYGLRRAHGPDGALSASRAAFVGGCAGTSNVMAGKKFGIPLMGMHAQEGDSAFDMEAEEFDEDHIEKLKRQGAAIQAWGMGTDLTTGAGQASVGAVYQLTGMADENGMMNPVQGLEPKANPFPLGILQVRRLRWGNVFAGDMVHDPRFPLPKEAVLMDPIDGTMRKRIPAEAPWEDLLIPVFRLGELIWEKPSLESCREHTRKQLENVHPGIKLLRNPYRYPVGLEPSLNIRKRRILAEERLRSADHHS